MQELYRSPLRVYICVLALGLWGVLSSLSLPISLFPDSSKPTVSIYLPYGAYSPEEFLQSYGRGLESRLRNLKIDGVGVDEITANYMDVSAQIRIEFSWGVDGDQALRETEAVVSGLSAAWPEEIRQKITVNSWTEGGGFFAISFYSDSRGIEELYNYLNPIFSPKLAAVTDAEGASLYNPERRVVILSLDPEKMAGLRVLPNDVEYAVRRANQSLGGGRLAVGEDSWTIESPRKLTDLDSLRNLPVRSRSGQVVLLRDVAQVRLDIDYQTSQNFRTSGAQSVLLFANPKPGANIKRMSDELLKIVEEIARTLPPDIHYKVLVNPSEFINASITHVAREVALAAGLAVLVLFIFIGSLKNVATAAIEIPLSIVMAFILMKLTGVNINLISLGGLALSAGMNVDASVVVMENIFRHFAQAKGRLVPEERLRLVILAVREVWLPIIASTVASLVVFIPLLMTQGITNSILGDLARAVVYSHGLSAFVALLLVPTIRLHLMQSETQFHSVSPIEGFLIRIEALYGRLLEVVLHDRKVQWILGAGVLVVLGLHVGLLLPKLERELIGRPDTDWLIMGVNPNGNYEPREVTEIVSRVESQALEKYSKEVDYTFTQITRASGWIMFRLKDRDQMNDLWKEMEKDFPPTPQLSFWFEPWNPSELRLPEFPEVLVHVQGGSANERQSLALDLRNLLNETQRFQRVSMTPNEPSKKMIQLLPIDSVIREQEALGSGVSLVELSAFTRVATLGKTIDSFKANREMIDLRMEVAQGRFQSLADLKALPLGVGQKILPLSALAQVEVVDRPASVYREDLAELHKVRAYVSQSNKSQRKAIQNEAQSKIEEWQKSRSASNVSVEVQDSDTVLNESIQQLSTAVALSVLLILIVMIIQFGTVMEALVVMIPIPLGLIGVILSLSVFGSTLSLNSVLGLILLNGISVANSILIVDFARKLLEDGISPFEAVKQACLIRLRPILMTSLTTILGMLPIALGTGEGGKILQPLGISVSGGLWLSMLLTLFLVPMIYLWFLKERVK